jgi:hypothetical protein
LLLVALVAGYLGKDAVVLASMCLCVALLPLATGAAILRDRLYDLDRIISRTLTYGLLTVLLAGGYALVVLGLGQLLGRDSSLVVAAATLAVAGPVSAGPPPHPSDRGSALQPPQIQRGQDRRSIQRPLAGRD